MNPCSDDLYWEKFGDCTISSFCFFAKFSWYLFHTENRIIFQNKMRIVDSPIYPYTLFSPNLDDKFYSVNYNLQDEYDLY